jgi:hypothetical protein
MGKSWAAVCVCVVVTLALAAPAGAMSVSGTITGVVTSGDSALAGGVLPYGLDPATFAGTPIRIDFQVNASLAPSVSIAPSQVILSSDGPFVDFMSTDVRINNVRVQDFSSLVRQTTARFYESQIPGSPDQLQLQFNRVDPAFTGTFARQLLEANLLETSFGAGAPFWTDLSLTPTASSTGSFEEFQVNQYYVKLNFQLTSFTMHYAPEPSLAPLLALALGALALRRRGGAEPCTTPTRSSRPGRA